MIILFIFMMFKVENEYIKHVVASTGNNKTRAAEILGIDRKTLWDKLKKAEMKE